MVNVKSCTSTTCSRKIVHRQQGTKSPGPGWTMVAEYPYGWTKWEKKCPPCESKKQRMPSRKVSSKSSRSKSRKPKSNKSRKSAKRVTSSKSKAVSKSKAKPDTRGCTRQFTAKYMKRDSPPYPANQCCGSTKTGNDGMSWTSSRTPYQKACNWKRSK